MEQAAVSEKVVRSYLLGELPEEERERIEQGMLTDEAFFETLLALEDVVEDELIDDYLNGLLASREKDGFEQVFLTSHERREKLELARGLSARAASAAGHHPAASPHRTGARAWWRTLLPSDRLRTPAFGLSLAAALLLLVVGCGWLLSRVQRLGTELDALRAQQQQSQPPGEDLREQLERQRARNEELAANLSRAEERRAELERVVDSLNARAAQSLKPPDDSTPARRPDRARPPVLSLILPLLRGRSSDVEGVKAPTLPAGTGRAQLILALDAIKPKDYGSYWVSVENSDGVEVWKTNRVNVGTKGTENHLTVTLSAAALPAGEYSVKLTARPPRGESELIGLYSFRIAAR
ncbi:MAG: hypothetical protein LC800_21835 [Acidobacteria bacterium]|nr:hypothetical protein [Acidobacteriota bacterium]